VVLVTAQLVGRGLPDHDPVPDLLRADGGASAGGPGRRSAYFGAEAGWIETDFINRAQLTEARRGPLIIEEYDATCVVPPGASAELDAYGNIIVMLD
jgi:N-methylhydantoinase A